MPQYASISASWEPYRTSSENINRKQEEQGNLLGKIQKNRNTEIFTKSIPASWEPYIMSRESIIRRNEEVDKKNQFKESFSVISILFEKLLQSLSRKFVLFRCSLTRSYPRRTQVPWAQFSHIGSVYFIGIATKRQRRRRTPGAAKNLSLSTRPPKKIT